MNVDVHHITYTYYVLWDVLDGFLEKIIDFVQQNCIVVSLSDNGCRLRNIYIDIYTIICDRIHNAIFINYTIEMDYKH